MAFRGTYDHALDAKNRLTVPARFRAALAGGVVLAKGVERCVAVWTPDGYAGFVEASLGGAHPLSPDARRMRRFFAANAFDTELDSAGRVMVPPFLMEHAGLAKQVTVIGAEESFELWNPGAWAEYDAAVIDDLPDITARLGHPG